MDWKAEKLQVNILFETQHFYQCSLSLERAKELLAAVTSVVKNEISVAEFQAIMGNEGGEEILDDVIYSESKESSR